jgi:hypothetical protein
MIDVYSGLSLCGFVVQFSFIAATAAAATPPGGGNKHTDKDDISDSIAHFAHFSVPHLQYLQNYPQYS